ncbi:unnamed protein product [Linum tenue]|uniref:Uncharacterized protein n=1 Tax=Linum tenue TaxID=586396 RepID=A0AAV0PB78_9ROSI|nr:unnamed protein product [Linum tenue]
MGNCCRKSVSSTAVWADDDWETLGDDNHKMVLFDADAGEDHHGVVGVSGGGGEGDDDDSSSSASGREVKIKVSRRELEELMSRVEMQGLSSEQILARLISSAGAAGLFADEDDHHRHWRPVLQSIPEV